MKRRYWRLFEVAADQGTETIQEAPDSGASLVQEAPPADASADGAPPWAAEHPEWKPEDVWKSYTELRTRFSRGEHTQPETVEQPAEEPYDPYAALGPGDDERTLSELHAVFRGERTLTDGSRGPQAVMDLILQSEAAGQPVVSAQWKSNYLAAWQQQDPWSAQQYVADHAWKQREERLRQEFEEKDRPYKARVQYGVNETALAKAAERIPEWGTWGPPVMNFLAANPNWIADVMHDPDAMVQRMRWAYAILAIEASDAQAGAQPAAAPNGAKPPPRTATRSTSTPPSDQDARRAAVLASLKEHRSPAR